MHDNSKKKVKIFLFVEGLKGSGYLYDFNEMPLILSENDISLLNVQTL